MSIPACLLTPIWAICILSAHHAVVAALAFCTAGTFLHVFSRLLVCRTESTTDRRINRAAQVSLTGYAQQILPSGELTSGKMAEVEVAILGGGICGVLAAQQCTEKHMTFRILERMQTLGGVWSFRANTHSHLQVRGRAEI